MARKANGFRRLYRCLECGKGTMFTKREEDRAARLRCSACGSARLEMSAMGAERLVDANDAGREARAAIERNGSSSILP